MTDIAEAMLNYEAGQFDLDNFDLLLIIQSITHLERSELGKDPLFMRQYWQLATTAETFVVKHFDRLNVQEFTTMLLFYMRSHQHDSAVSR